MIRIETTAEFDAHGHFTVSGQTTDAVPAGRHRVVIEVEELQTQKNGIQPPAEPLHPLLAWKDGLLVWTGPVPEGIDTLAREILDERAQRFMEGDCE